MSSNQKFDLLKTLGWIYFILVQIVSVITMMIGWVLLIIPCVKRAWMPVTQIYQPDWSVKAQLPKKTIYVWSWNWLNPIWGNNEDGVCGTREYNPSLNSFRAYLWSAWRNSANNLRFIFKWVGGPFYEVTWNGWYFHCGWYPNGFPVLSAGKI